MYINNGDVSKTNWVEVGVRAVVGAASGGTGVAITSAARSVGSAAVTNGGMSAAIRGAGAMVQNALQDPQFAPVVRFERWPSLDHEVPLVRLQNQ